ncbi:MAG: 50S ribosomal protein L25/general stress protein Ctc [Mycobacterium sp.]
MAKSKAHAANNLIAEVREKTGKGASRQARRDGKVPAVLYGHGTEPQHLTLPSRELSAVLRNFGTNAVLTLDIGGTEALALPKQLEIHPIKRNIQHVDLIIVRRGEKVTVDVNVLIEGDAQPGALVTQETNSIEIESDAMSIPDQLTVSVEGVVAGTQITAADIELPEGVTLISDPELLVINIVTAPTEEELEAEGGGAPVEAQLEEQAAEEAEASE